MFVETEEGFPTVLKALYYSTCKNIDSPYSINRMDTYIRIDNETIQKVTVNVNTGKIDKVLETQPNPYGKIPAV